MKNSEWKDQKLENLLKQMPKVTDERDPNTIYQNALMKLNNQSNFLQQLIRRK